MTRKIKSNINQKPLFDIDNKFINVNNTKNNDDKTKEIIEPMPIAEFENNKIPVSWEEILEIFKCEIKNELAEIVEDVVEKKLSESDEKNIYTKTIEIKNADLEKVKETYNNYIQSNNLDSEGRQNVGFIRVPPFSINTANVNTILGEYLERNGISQTWLAEATGLSRGTIVNMIKNPNSASMQNAKKVCLALNKRFDELFY